MRKIVVHMQVTLDGRISRPDGLFWEPFPFGEAETAYVNHAFRQADTWALGGAFYRFVVPFWEEVAAGRTPDGVDPVTAPGQEFAQILGGMTKLVYSRTLEEDPATKRVVVTGDFGDRLAELKTQEGDDILLSAGPPVLGPLLNRPGLVDELFLVQHPAVLAAGPQMFEDVSRDLALDLIHAEVFEAGAIISRYQIVEPL